MAKERKPLGRTARAQSLDSVLAKIAEDRGLRIASLADMSEEVDAISTGNIAIDYITGVGGLPKGRIVELYGPPSSGKTTLALQTCATAQKAGLNILYLDYEHALDSEYCKALGLDLNASSFLLAQPETMEQGFNAMRELVETGQIGVVVVDSVASMTIEKELSIESGASTFADKAKLMAQAMRQITGILHKYNTLCIFLNHVQQVIDSSPVGQKMAAQGIKQMRTPGGEALKYHSSVRMEFKPIGTIKSSKLNPVTNEKEDLITQTNVAVKIPKNKVAPPMKSCVVRVRFGEGFSQVVAVLHILMAYSVITKTKQGVVTFHSSDIAPKDWDLSKTIRGEEKVIEMMLDDDEWFERATVYAESLLSGQTADTAIDLADFTEDEDSEDGEDVG